MIASRLKDSSISAAVTYSLLLHLLAVIVALLIAKGTATMRLPSPYVVSLVDSTMPSPSTGSGAKEPVKAEERETRAVEPPAAKPAMTLPRETKKTVKKEEDHLVNDRIDALRAKKRLEQLASLRKVVTVGAAQKTPQTRPANPGPKGNAPGAGSGPAGGGDYYSLVEGRIRQQWVFPEAIDRDLEAIISIKIAKDGNVTIDRIEKSSGSPLFDRSVMRAIANASPLPPPPRDIEMGVRFRP